MSSVDITPRRLSLSAIVEMLLTRDRSAGNSVTLSRTASGSTTIEVVCRTGDDGEHLSLADASRVAMDVYSGLSDYFPEAESHDNATVSLSRNAKGETQIEVSARTSEAGPRTVAELAEAVTAQYDKQRRAYPMSNGKTAAEGSVA